jgi:hypothetical protein
MSFRSTPGPGGFGPSPAFGHAHPGFTLNPARTSPRPGIYSGGNAATSHVWWWVALVVAVALVTVVVLAVRRRRA